jgi:hypothetical protein
VGSLVPILPPRPFGPAVLAYLSQFLAAIRNGNHVILWHSTRAAAHRRVFGLTAIVLCALQTGCVQRRLTIRTNPPGAMVYVDNYPLGTSPVSTDFVYYGTRKVRIVKSGFETLTVMQPIPAPWYQYPVLDFVTENLVPGEIRDERVVEYQLQPQTIVPNPQLLERGENLRQVSAGPSAAAAAGAPVPGIPAAAPAIGQPPIARPGPPSSPPSSTRPGSPFPF